MVVVSEVCCYGLWLFSGFDEDFFWDEFMAFLVLLCMEVGSPCGGGGGAGIGGGLKGL